MSVQPLRLINFPILSANKSCSGDHSPDDSSSGTAADFSRSTRSQSIKEAARACQVLSPAAAPRCPSPRCGGRQPHCSHRGGDSPARGPSPRGVSGPSGRRPHGSGSRPSELPPAQARAARIN
ncbi:mCG1041398 [Mus musculus]|nr:mCG1041398 [Mus musculus]